MVELTSEQIDELAARIVASMKRQAAEQAELGLMSFGDAAWAELVDRWWTKFGTAQVAVSELLDIAERIPGLPISGSTPRGRTTSLGMQLRNVLNSSINGHTVVMDRRRHGSRHYRLLPTA